MAELHKPMENQRDEATASAPGIAGLQSRCRTLTIFVFREKGRIPTLFLIARVRDLLFNGAVRFFSGKRRFL